MSMYEWPSWKEEEYEELCELDEELTNLEATHNAPPEETS